MDRDGHYHECDECDFAEGWHECPACGVEHRPPTAEEQAQHDTEYDAADAEEG